MTFWQLFELVFIYVIFLVFISVMGAKIIYSFIYGEYIWAILCFLLFTFALTIAIYIIVS